MFMPADLAYALPIVAVAYLVLGLAAFGSALIAVPLLAWRWPLAEVVPLILMLDVLASILLGGLNLKSVAFAEIRRMLPGLVLGTRGMLYVELEVSGPSVDVHSSMAAATSINRRVRRDCSSSAAVCPRDRAAAKIARASARRWISPRTSRAPTRRSIASTAAAAGSGNR